MSAASDGQLFAVGDWNSCRNGRLVAFNSSNGSFRDHGDCPGGGNTSPHPRQVPAIDEINNSVHFGSTQLCSVDMDTLINNWDEAGGSYIGGQGIAIDQAGNVYYATNTGGGNTGQVRSYTASGAFRWQRGFSTSDSPEVLAIADSKLLLYFKDIQSLVAWDTVTGADITTGDWPVAGFTRAVVDESGTIYASGVSTAEVIALHPDGSEEWRIDLADEGASEAHVDFVAAGGLLLVRSDSILLALNTENAGEAIWNFPAGARIKVPVALDSEGHVVIFDDNKMLYVLDTSINYADSEWPVAEFADSRNSSKAR